jgi:hypothetical protein
MKDNHEHHIDKLFHESLDGNRIDPNPVVWKSLSANIPAGRGSNVLSFTAAAMVLAFLSLLLNYQLNIYSEDQELVRQQTEESLLERPENKTGQDAPPSSDLNEDTRLPSASSSTATVDPLEDEIKTATVKTDSKVRVTDESVTTPPASTDKIIAGFEKEFYPSMSSVEAHQRILLESSRDLEGTERTSDHSSPVFNMSLEDSYVKEGKLELGATFGPAVSIYPNGQNRNDFTFEILAVYENSRVFAEGGIGAYYSSESAKYGITYSSYDSVGYFINVDAFTVDPQNPESIRFNTSTKNIYDSIRQYRIEEKTNKYAYLQLPLRVGYRVIETGRFSLDLKAGIIFSWQIFKDVPEIPYQENDIDQIEVIRNYPDRLKTNWQYTAGIGINYHISNYIRLGIDPFYRQYINSVYAPDSKYSAKSPYAFGIRGGLFIEF